MNRDQIIQDIARQHLGIDTLQQCEAEQLDLQSVAVSSVRKVLEAAFDAGKLAAATSAAADNAYSGAWTSMTVDEAGEHLKSWIDNLEAPEIALALIQVCGCTRAAVIDEGKRIMVEMP